MNLDYLQVRYINSEWGECSDTTLKALEVLVIHGQAGPKEGLVNEVWANLCPPTPPTDGSICD